MAAYAIATYTVEDKRASVVASALETQLETLDSTNDPVVLCSIVYNPSSKTFTGILLTS